MAERSGSFVESEGKLDQSTVIYVVTFCTYYQRIRAFWAMCCTNLLTYLLTYLLTRIGSNLVALLAQVKRRKAKYRGLS